MDQRLTFITLGVRDLDTMKSWYKEKFGWVPFTEQGDICFFKLNGLVLALYPKHELAHDAGIPAEGSGFKSFTLSINFHSVEEINRITQDLRAKGVRIVREPENVFWGGYRGYIADPEDNYWELAYNPYMPLDEHGNVL